MTATQLRSTPSSTALPSAPLDATSPQHPNRLPLQAIPAYEVLLQQQEQSRGVFGRMLLNWRRRNGWTQYTAFSWAEAIGEPSLVISYGNLSVIEQGKAGELQRSGGRLISWPATASCGQCHPPLPPHQLP